MATATSYTKAGVDAKAAPLATTAPLAPGTPTAGTSGAAARADHVHPPQAGPRRPVGLGDTAIGSSVVTPIGRRGPAGRMVFDTFALAAPLPVDQDMSITRLGIHVSTAAAGSTTHLAVYAANKHGLPDGAPLATGTVASDTTGDKFWSLTTPIALTPGLYVVACHAQPWAGSGPILARPEDQNVADQWLPSFQASGSALNYPPGYRIVLVSGAWPTLNGTVSGLNSASTDGSVFFYGLTTVA